MPVSLIITTYNRPDALAVVLKSITAQKRMPEEIIIADDGSGPETAEVVNKAAETLPIKHVWHEHDGFRAGHMRNLAIAASSGSYLIMIDGDIMLHPDFIGDHIAVAEKRQFIQGSRVILDSKATTTCIETEPAWPSFFNAGIGNRKNLLRSPRLSRWLSRKSSNLLGIKTCNFAVWRHHAIAVNGFNEDFVGWGCEDSEFAARLMNSGVKRLNLRFAGLCCHLHHPGYSRDQLAANVEFFVSALDNKLTRCANGLDKHMQWSESKHSGRLAPHA